MLLVLWKQKWFFCRKYIVKQEREKDMNLLKTVHWTDTVVWLSPLLTSGFHLDSVLQHSGCLKGNFLLQVLVTLAATLLKAEFDSDKISYLTVVLSM